MKPDKKKAYINLRIYFTVIVLAEVFGMLLLTAGLTKALGRSFHFSLDYIAILTMLFFSLLIGYSVNIFLSRFFFRPITRLGTAMRKVAKGDFSATLDPDIRIREIQNLYRDFNTMTQELGATEIIQSDFVSNVSHEFKTPINAIQGYATLLQGEQSPEAEAEYVNRILLNTSRLSDLVGNILLLSKLDNSSLERTVTTYRLDEQIRLSLVLLEDKWTEKDIDLDVDLDEIEYRGYENLMAHVWSNLIGNAVKFSPRGGRVSLRLNLNEALGQIIFTIEDEGPGIDEAALSHIFERFFQADSSHKTEGNGLGLSLVRKIVGLSGGLVTASNRTDGTGSIFRVVLPRDRYEEETL
ncbi:MAG: HAMP domain-containing histidine kinase [Lachnospiraceae bacterium]|nr:HAMP domain-containing histidine kinase [Lachnospiraceae bacterium]